MKKPPTKDEKRLAAQLARAAARHAPQLAREAAWDRVKACEIAWAQRTEASAEWSQRKQASAVEFSGIRKGLVAVACDAAVYVADHVGRFDIDGDDDQETFAEYVRAAHTRALFLESVADSLRGLALNELPVDHDAWVAEREKR